MREKIRRGVPTGMHEDWTPVELENIKRIAAAQDVLTKELGRALVHSFAEAATWVTGPIASALIIAVDHYIQSGSLEEAAKISGIVAAIGAAIGMTPAAMAVLNPDQLAKRMAQGFATLLTKAEATLGRKLTANEAKLLSEGRLVVMESEAAAKKAAIEATGIAEKDVAEQAIKKQ